MKTLPLVLTLILMGGGQQANLLAADAAKTPAAQTAPAAPPAKPVAVKVYLLHPADVIMVDVVDDAKASHEYKIGDDGKIKPVYLKTAVPLAGLSIAAAGDALSKAYVEEKIFAQPQITVSVKEYTIHQVYFIGSVNKQGPIPIPDDKGLTLVQALAQAGGPMRIAAGSCSITRINPDGTTTVLQNVDLVGATKDAKKDVLLQEGDVIFLGESLIADVWQ